MTNDTEHEIVTIEKVEPSGGGYTLTRSDGCCFFCPPIPDGYAPQPGDSATFYGRGFGHLVRGLVVNGHVAFYRTAAEQEQKHQQDVAARDRKRRDEFEKNREQMDRDFDSLPPVFQKRIARYRANQPNFRWQHEPYEMVVCVDAVKIAAALKTPGAVKAFHGLPWDQQMTSVPGLSDGHSGNTFGCAVRLAHNYLTDPDLVWLGHAAISPLVGCDEAGCPPVPESEVPERFRNPRPLREE